MRQRGGSKRCNENNITRVSPVTASRSHGVKKRWPYIFRAVPFRPKENIYTMPAMADIEFLYVHN